MLKSITRPSTTHPGQYDQLLWHRGNHQIFGPWLAHSGVWYFSGVAGQSLTYCLESSIVTAPYSKRTMTLAAVGATTSATIQCLAETLILLGGLSKHPLSCQPTVNVRYLA